VSNAAPLARRKKKSRPMQAAFAHLYVGSD